MEIIIYGEPNTVEAHEELVSSIMWSLPIKSCGIHKNDAKEGGPREGGDLFFSFFGANWGVRVVQTHKKKKKKWCKICQLSRLTDECLLRLCNTYIYTQPHRLMELTNGKKTQLPKHNRPIKGPTCIKNGPCTFSLDPLTTSQ